MKHARKCLRTTSSSCPPRPMVDPLVQLILVLRMQHLQDIHMCRVDVSHVGLLGPNVQQRRELCGGWVNWFNLIISPCGRYDSSRVGHSTLPNTSFHRPDDGDFICSMAQTMWASMKWPMPFRTQVVNMLGPGQSLRIMPAS
jgi:hypothetical protein